MSVGKALAVAAVAMMCGAALEAARADEAYVCEGGKLVYVAFKDLDRMKRENACVAAYYGLTAAGAPAGGNSGAPASAAAAAGTDEDDGELPVEKASNVGKVTPGLGPRRKAGAAQQASTAPTASSGPKPLPMRTLPAPGPSDPPADFRNVKILNATPGGDGVHRHTH